MMLREMARTPRKQPPRQAESSSHAGHAARGVIRQIDEQLQHIQRQLAQHEPLIAERERLLAARKALTGEAAQPKQRRVSQDDVAAYLQEHPGSLPAQIATALSVPVTNVSQHLYRGKDTRFHRQQDGWHLRRPRS
jgi:hypothetical protein